MGKIVSCPFCGGRNETKEWPVAGNIVPYYCQEEPGKFSIKMHCPHCDKDWYVVWDQDPGLVIPGLIPPREEEKREKVEEKKNRVDEIWDLWVREYATFGKTKLGVLCRHGAWKWSLLDLKNLYKEWKKAYAEKGVVEPNDELFVAVPVTSFDDNLVRLLSEVKTGSREKTMKRLKD